MNAFGVAPKDVLPGRAVAGPGEDVAVGVCDLPRCRRYSGITRATFFEDPQPARGKPASAAQSMRSGRAAG